MTNQTPKEPVRALLDEIVDYAGLFPPSGLSMPEAVANYAAYKNSIYAWMLGRFIVPVARLDEFYESARVFVEKAENKPWRLSVLASADINDTLSRIEDSNKRHAPRIVCDAIEVKAENGAEIEAIAENIPSSLTTYFEVSLDADLADAVATLAIYGQRAKIRTGGVTADAFPKPEQITRFMRICLAANVPFKATAGLHHPVRCIKPLTYEKNAPEGVMNGFLNLFLAAGLLMQGHKTSLINELLEEQQAENFWFDARGVLWRQEYFISTAQLKVLRSRGAISFGSCSFDEPVTDLQEFGIL